MFVIAHCIVSFICGELFLDTYDSQWRSQKEEQKYGIKIKLLLNFTFALKQNTSCFILQSVCRVHTGDNDMLQ